MKRLAIIGMGPRGLYALEKLLTHLANSQKEIEILVFETSDKPGAGNVWYTEQSVTNWINITERALGGIDARLKTKYGDLTIDPFPSYHDWSQFSQNEMQVDAFPPRRKLGNYLSERFTSIEIALKTLNNFKFIKSEVLNINFEDHILKLSTKNETWECDDVLLTIGHQPTQLSEQLKKWKSHSKNNDKLHVFEEPYPVSQLSAIKNNTNVTIGVRGFGLAMIDVMRYLVTNNFGNFKVVDQSTFETIYYKIKEQNLVLIPFSLDGLPMAPKPISENIDNWYKPTPKELGFLKSQIEAITKTNKEVDTIDFLIQPIAEIASRVFIDLKEKAIDHSLKVSEIKAVIFNWLKDADYSHHLLQKNTVSTYQQIQEYIDLALGIIPISLDYCVWQVWKHCQPTLYKTLSHADLEKEIVKDVIALDERSKRYSYGPPIESMQQILALIDANVLNLDFVNDPNIKLVEQGWELKNKHNKTMTTSIMLNSVLDAPKLLEINSTLVKNLLQNDLIQPLHSELGIETSDDGYVNTLESKQDAPIAVLGRVAKGSVVGVDAILECFGPRIENWAKAYVKKLDD